MKLFKLVFIILSLFFITGIASAANISASFTSNLTNGYHPFSVQFNDTSTGSPTSWNWDFGDGNTSTLQNPVHTYYINGQYNVSLNVSDGSTYNVSNKTNYIYVTTYAFHTGDGYDKSQNLYYLSGNSFIDLPWLEAQTENKSVISHNGSIYYLNASVYLIDGSNFYINRSTVSTLYISNQINGTSKIPNNYNGISSATGSQFYINNVSILGWDYSTNLPVNNSASTLMHPITLTGGELNDVVFEGIYNLHLSRFRNTNVTNIHINNTIYDFYLYGCYYFNLNNITYNNSHYGHALITESSTCHDIHIDNFNSYSTGGGGIDLVQCDNSTITNADIYKTGWMNIGIDQCKNCTIANCTLEKSGHTSLDIHAGAVGVDVHDLYVNNVSINDSTSNNVILSGGTGGDVYNITLKNITSNNSGDLSSGIAINYGGHAPLHDIIIQNYTSTNDVDGLTTDHVNNLTVINSRITNSTGKGLKLDYTNATFLDSYIGSYWFFHNNTMKFINTYCASKYDYYTGNILNEYLYPNLKIINPGGYGIQDSIVTVNTSSLTGNGTAFVSGVSDANGKLYSNGNRTNWLSIPYKTTIDNSVTLAGPTLITATKSGSTNNTTVTPVSTWYSVYPASLNGSEIPLTLNGMATPVISWANPNNITHGTALNGTQYNATANVAGHFVYTPIEGTILDVGNNQELIADFFPDDTANYSITSKTVHINVTAALIIPTANFSANATSGDYPLAIQFTDSSTGSPTMWAWNFGDGSNNVTTQNPSHEYESEGTYTVILTASNANGSDVETKVDYINVTEPQSSNPPIANFTGTPVSGYLPMTVSFTDHSENDPTEWSWNFGDGNFSANQNPSHTYYTSGTYNVSLEVINVEGGDSITRTGYIIVLPKIQPVANYTSNVTNGSIPLYVQFNDTSTNSTSRLWVFGDGNTSTSQNPVHVYYTVGNYTVNLTATNENGSNTKSVSNYISARAALLPPDAEFRTNTTIGIVPVEVKFYDRSTNSPTSWNYSFGDGNYSTEQNPVHTYYGTGYFTVTLNVTNTDGNDSLTKKNYVYSASSSSDIRYIIWQILHGNWYKLTYPLVGEV